MLIFEEENPQEWYHEFAQRRKRLWHVRKLCFLHIVTIAGPKQISEKTL